MIQHWGYNVSIEDVTNKSSNLSLWLAHVWHEFTAEYGYSNPCKILFTTLFILATDYAPTSPACFTAFLMSHLVYDSSAEVCRNTAAEAGDLTKPRFTRRLKAPETDQNRASLSYMCGRICVQLCNRIAKLYQQWIYRACTYNVSDMRSNLLYHHIQHIYKP